MPEPAQPSPEALAGLAAHVTGEQSLVRAVWDQLRARAPQLRTRPDVTADFLAEAMAEAAAAGLLKDLLFEIAAQRLTDGKPYMEACEALIGESPTGSQQVSDDDEEEDEEQAELLVIHMGGDPPGAVSDQLPRGLRRARYQGYLPKNAEETLEGKSRALDRVCRVVVDKKVRGCGVLVNDFVVATSAHVVEPLIEADPAGGFRAKGDTLERLVLHFPRGGTGRDVASLATDWLLSYSPVADCERSKPFDVYDVNDIAFPDGPWDVALLRLARPPAHVQLGNPPVNEDPPDFRFKITVLHSPRADSAILDSEGEFLGRLNANAWLRLLHNAKTIAGTSGAPCFNSDWQIVAIHQGGANDAQATGKVNRAIPAAAWFDKVRKAEPMAPIAWQAEVPAIDGTPAQPVIGRRQLQRRIHAARRADAAAVERLFVIRGAKGRGKSFSIRLLQHLREQGHVMCALDLEGMAGIDETRFAGLVLGALGDGADAKAQPNLSTRDREVLNATLPDVVSRIATLARNRQVWLAFDGYDAAGLIESAGIGQFLDGLILELERQPQLRLMLADWSRPIPAEYAPAISNLDQQDEWPTLDDLVDYIELHKFPPGEPMPANIRQFVAGLLGPANAVLARTPDNSPLFYAELLEAANLQLLLRGT